MKRKSILGAVGVLLALGAGCSESGRPVPPSRAALAGDLTGTYYAWAELHYWAFGHGLITWRDMILTVDGNRFEYVAVYGIFANDDLVHCNPTFRGKGLLAAACDSLTMHFGAGAEPIFADFADMASLGYEVRRNDDKLLLIWRNPESNDAWVQWMTIEMSHDSTIDWEEVDWDTW